MQVVAVRKNYVLLMKRTSRSQRDRGDRGQIPELRKLGLGPKCLFLHIPALKFCRVDALAETVNRYSKS